MRPEIKPLSLGILVGFFSTLPQWKLQDCIYLLFYIILYYIIIYILYYYLYYFILFIILYYYIILYYLLLFIIRNDNSNFLM